MLRDYGEGDIAVISWLLRRNYHKWDKFVGWLQWNDTEAWLNPNAHKLYNIRLHRATLMLFYVTLIILAITAATLVLTAMLFFCAESPQVEQ